MRLFSQTLPLAALYILVLSLISSCTKDSSMTDEEPFCLDAYGPGIFVLSDVTLTKYPYPTDDSLDSLLFADSAGNVLVARFVDAPHLTTFTRWPNEVPCREDSTQLIRILGEYQSITAELSIDSLEIGFVMRYSANHDPTQYFDRIYNEIGNIYVTTYNDDDFLRLPIPQLSLLINENNRPRTRAGTEILLDQVELNGVSYTQVYLNDYASDKFLIYYNFEQGLVGFMDQRDGVVYNLIE